MTTGGRRQIHALTPGDHFSPRTGSAIPTVVDGLCRHTRPLPAVLVASATFPDRYESAEIIEYPLVETMHGAPQVARGMDAVVGRMGMARPRASRTLGQLLVEQGRWAPAHLIAHNAPQLVPLVAPHHSAVLHVHNDLLGSYSRRETARVLARVHRVVGVSDWVAERTAERLPAVLRERVRVVPNGVDVDFFARHPRTEREGPLRVAFLGRMQPWKGPDVLLRAVARSGRKDLDVTVVGSSGFDREAALTPFERDLRRVAGGARAQVSFLPFQERAAVARFLAGVDVCVVPSVEPEPFGLVALEAMAAGAAVVAARSGGLPEAVGTAGLVVPPGDVAGLAEVLVALADDEAEVARLRAAGAARAREMDWCRIAPVYQRSLE